MIAKISKIPIITLILLTFTSTSFADTYTAKLQWKEYKSTHFIIHYHPNIPTSYIRAFSRRCEQYYRSIADRLGLRRFDFWTWDSRARIVVYDTQENYIKHRSRPNWSAASVYVKDKLISTYCFDEQFFDSILAHEIAHIVLRELIGFDADVPLWFEEGVACANEQGCQLKYLSTAKRFLDKGYFIPVTEMEKLSNSQIKSKSYTTFYSISASMVLFLQDNYGKANFQRLCRNLRDGHTFYQALHKAYHIKSPQDLQAQFLTYLSHQ